MDRAALRAQFRAAQPFPHIQVDGFLDPQFARSVVAAYPDAQRAREVGKSFDALNERGKTQVTDTSAFGAPVRQLNELLASRPWLETISDITGIPNLLPDPNLVGGGMHLMRSGALLDVHVDFNVLEEQALHRRLNILLFLNEGWQSGWGGRLELWDAHVRECSRRFEPVFNRMVLFQTSETSFHGVERLRCPADRARLSFAAYYYTAEAPPGWNGRRHTTVFRARPEERGKRLLMPLAKAGRVVTRTLKRLARGGRPSEGEGERDRR